MRTFAVRVERYPSTWIHYLVEADTLPLAEEVFALREDYDRHDRVVWGVANTREYRDAWRLGAVIQLKDRKLPQGIDQEEV